MTTVTDRLFGENSSVAVKAPVVAVANVNIGLSGLGAISVPGGNYTPNSGDRILVLAQTDPTQNGIYNASTAAWTRTGDFDGANDCVQGTLVTVLLNASPASLAFYQLTTANPTIGTSALNFAPLASNPNLTYPQTQQEINAGITPVNTSYPPFPFIDVRRYGAVGDGVTDSTTAIQNAIRVANNYWTAYSANIAFGGSGTTPDLAMGGTVYFPPGIFIVNSPLLLAPGVKLLGQCNADQIGGVTTGTNGSPVSIIRAGAGFSGQLWYVIDTGNWRVKDESGNPLSPYRVVSGTDIFFQGGDVGNEYGSFCCNFAVQGLVIDGNSHAFGCLRTQLSARFHIDNNVMTGALYVGMTNLACYEYGIGPNRIYGQPIGHHMCSCESAMQDGAELEIYTAATSAWVSGNQGTINAAFYPFADQVGTYYNLTLKDVLIQWSLNITLNYLAAHSGNIALELYNANVSIGHWENEFTTGGPLILLREGSYCDIRSFTTKSAIPLASGDASSKLVIWEPLFLQSSISFTPLNGESSSTFEIQLYNPKPQPDPILGTVTRYSTVNLTRLFPFTGQVALYCDSSLGTANEDGLTSAHPTTLDSALTWIEHHPHIKDWLINLIGGETHVISSAHTLKDTRIEFATLGGTGDAAISITTAPLVTRAYLWFAFINISWASLTEAFTVAANCEFDFDGGALTIPNNGVIFQGNAMDTARVQVHGYAPVLHFGTSAGLCAGASNSFINYEDDLIGQTITGTAALEGISSGKVKKIASNVV